MDKKKRCTSCGQKKSVTEFYKATSTKDGYSYQCKLCAIDYSKDYRDSNKEACNKIKKSISKVKRESALVGKRC